MNEEITILAETNFRNENRKFGIKTEDRRKHFYVIGKTGMGKTTLLENMAVQDIQRGFGVGIVDPHGEFAEKMLNFVPSSRVNDVIYFNPADLDFPIAFNAMEKVDSAHRHLVASGLIAVFNKIWADSWGPRLEYVLRNAILALLEYPGSTLLGLMRILVDKNYRKKVVDRITDPVVKSFWVEEFTKYPDRFMAEAVAPIQNKVGQFLTSPLIRNIVGQTKSSINLREAMDSQKILIMSLSKGKIGEDNSALLGAMLITRLQLAAMSRIDIPEEERKDFYLYVDEFQNFSTESFANVLSEARKYRLNLILAHQYIGQLIHDQSTVVRDAVFGNVGTMIVFRVGATDAEFLEKEFEPEFVLNDLVNLGFKNIYIKLMIDGIASRPFSATTLPPLAKPEKIYDDVIIKVSRERYAKGRKEIEEKIAKWSGVIETEKSAAQLKPFEAKPVVPLYDVVCWQCGREIKVKFQPDGKRPVYCQDCLKKVHSSAASPQKEKNEFSRPNKPVQTGELIVKQAPDESISLGEAIKREPTDFGHHKKHHEVDLEGLRKTLGEVLGKEKEKMD